jgi:hypothetical protein
MRKVLDKLASADGNILVQAVIVIVLGALLATHAQDIGNMLHSLSHTLVTDAHKSFTSMKAVGPVTGPLTTTAAHHAATLPTHHPAG